ncbi:hypothetical protein I4O98_017665 [Clostridioides difficile]
MFGLLTAIISIIFSNYIIRLLGADSNTFAYVKQYLIFMEWVLRLLLPILR